MPAEDDGLRNHLADRDVPCPGCGYNLRGLASDRCPECNQPLRLAVSLQESHVSALLAAILPPIALAGAALVLLAVVMIFTAGRNLPRDDEAVIFLWMPLGAVLFLGLPALWLALPRGRSWFRTRSATARLNIVTASIIASGVLLGIYLLMLSRYA